MGFETLERRTHLTTSTDPVGVEYVPSPSPHLQITAVPSLGSGAGYDVYSRTLSSGSPGSWTKLNTSTLSESTTSYTISSPGTTPTEYRVDHKYSFGTVASSTYIAVGEEVPAVHSRGTILLAVDETISNSIDLTEYKRDLVADGWKVQVAEVPRADVPRYVPSSTEISAAFASSPQYVAWRAAVASTKSTIRDAYDESSGDLKAVLLIGHVAVPYAGTDSADGHTYAQVGFHGGATPADIFYSDLGSDSDWTDSVTKSGMMYAQNNNYPNDGKFDNDYLPTGHKMDLGIGRVDFSMLTAYGIPLATSSPPTPQASASTNEIDLLQNYFDRNHDWRSGAVTANRAAAYNVGFYGNYYDGPTENRLAANVGSSNLQYKTWVDQPSVPAGTQDDTYLWGIAAGSGAYAGINQYVPNDADSIATRDITYTYSVNLNAHVFADNANTAHTNKTVFNQIFGSFVGDWDKQNSLVMSSIAQDGGLGLATMYAGRPQWTVHTMALGESFIEGETRTMRSGSGYDFYSFYSRGTEVSLLGDPSLREHYVSPATSASFDVEEASTSGAREATVNWTASSDSSVAGYYVYWAPNRNGPFTLLPDNDADANDRVEGTSYVDDDPDHLSGFYMVRAALLEVTPSGSYWNLSTGTYATPVAHSAVFDWNDAPQSILVDMDDLTPISQLGTGLTVTLAGERYDRATASFIATTFTEGVDYDLDVAVPYDPIEDGAPVGWWLQLNVMTTSDSGVAGVLPSGRYELTISYAGHTFVKNIVYASGDVDGDGAVGFNDLLIVAQNYNTSVGEENSFGVGDFNDDGVVNFDDLLILAQNYNLVL